MKHITVLKSEATRSLNLNPDSLVVDATYGAGGHGELICSELGKDGVYIGIDADPLALEASKLKDNPSIKPTVHLVNDNFVNLKDILRSLHIKEVNAILADLGWRTDQFTDGGKGFSFNSDEPLLMTYGDADKYTFTAGDIVNDWDEENIADIIYGYGEERYSRRIANAVVEARRNSPITTAGQLADIVAQAIPGQGRGKIHPATKTFQALRIAVNDELQVLQKFIDEGLALLAPGGVMSIITFHSLEDRIVKLKFREHAQTDDFTLLLKKPLEPSREEILANPRSRSAKLRVIQRN
jgi:16S rRNA (cytosine1402-N4)-methyltransferase